MPEVYRDMLAEAGEAESPIGVPDRPLKRRKVVAGVSTSKPGSRGTNVEQHGTDGDFNNRGRNLQTVEDSSASEDDEESDFGFEDVDLEQPATSSPGPAEQDDEGIADVSISVNPTTTPKRNKLAKRKPASVAEKAFRLQVHKAHVLCLLGHCIYIDSWCNNTVVQHHLGSILSSKTLSYLNPKLDDSQFQQNRSFMDGLLQASDAFRGHFRVNASGMRKARWATIDGEPDGAVQKDTDPLDREEFINAARKLEGSQDTGNQLFCALLRAIGVEARLECSLQPLPFANARVKSSTPPEAMKTTVYAIASGTQSPATESNTEDSAIVNSSSIGKVPSVRRRLGQPNFSVEPTLTPTPTKKKPVRKLSYPIFWVEAFNTAHQKWIPVDPLVTQTINRPSKLEPPSSYDLNQMSYVIALESDGVARDVTRRYVKSFNAKTRRHRVESTESGAAWLKKALRVFRRRGGALDRDQVEDAELAQREAREGLPTNVQDFKDHPYYALERHLKRHEVLHPRREVGKVNAGTAANPRMEAVFRRQDVCACRSADKWFRVGREIIAGEQPIKHVPARRPKTNRAQSEDDGRGSEEKEMTALYAPFQTQLYIPPPVVKGRVPRNAYGNLDIYVPSMVPAGGTHIRHPLARDAARSLKIDYAEAVTGFQFKGMQVTAITEGVIVAAEYADAVNAIVEGLQDEQAEEESMARSTLALKMWKRFLTGLRIAERVSAYGDPGTEEGTRMEMDEQDDFGDAGGGFLPGDVADEEEALPTAGRFSLTDLSISSKAQKRSRKKYIEDESEVEAELSENQNVADDEERYESTGRSTRARRRILADESDDEHISDDQTLMPEIGVDEGGGGFLADDNVEGGGGFVAEANVEGVNNGGGFVAEIAEMVDDEGSGGGFVLDEAESGEQALTSGLSEGFVPEMSGALPYDGPDEAQTQQRAMTPPLACPEDQHAVRSHDTEMYDLERTGDNPAGRDGIKDTEIAKVSKDDATPLAKTVGQDQMVIDPLQEVSREEHEADQDSDRGSMISHDPEDEDAEPDWLESD